MALFLEPTGCKYVGKKCKLIVNMTIVESRHHAVTPCRVSDGEGGSGGVGEWGGSEWKRFPYSTSEVEH